MRNRILHLNTIVFNIIITLLVVKLAVSYLNVELGWWLRHLTPNVDKFNPLHLPKDLSGYIEYLLIPLMLFYIIANFSKIGSLIIPFFITFGLYFINIFTAIYAHTGWIDALGYSLKIASPIYLFIVIIIHIKNYDFNIKRLLITFAAYCLFLAVIALLIFDVSYNRDSERLPIYFNGLHTHCYVLAITFIGIALLIKKNQWLLYSFLFVSLAFLVLGYNVRTAVLFYFIFIAVILYQTNDFFKYAFAKIIIYIPFVFLLLLVFLKDVDFDSLSSGRLTMYFAKLDILKDYTFMDYMLGRGRGSDLISTSEWWYAKKGSHNDFLTYLVENGLPYMVGFILLIASVGMFVRKVSVYTIVLILGYFMTSALSNGLSTRPLAAYLFYLVLAYTFVMPSKDKLCLEK